MVRGYSGFLYLLLLIPFCFIIIGGGGLAYTLLRWGSSAERRAALRQKAANLEFFEKAAEGTQGFPNVPTDANFTNSPGTALAYRLPVAAAAESGPSPRWRPVWCGMGSRSCFS